MLTDTELNYNDKIIFNAITKERICPVCGKKFCTTTTKWAYRRDDEYVCSYKCSDARQNVKHDRKIWNDKVTDIPVVKKSLNQTALESIKGVYKNG